jgi:hypothetical protein
MPSEHRQAVLKHLELLDGDMSQMLHLGEALFGPEQFAALRALINRNRELKE